MKIIDQYCEWRQEPPADALQILELVGRVCYKSESRITDGSAAEFVKKILGRQHESVIEHVWASMLFVTDRGVTHEIVRHRVASYSQESTRYCNYCKGQFGGEITVVLPVWFRGVGCDFDKPAPCTYIDADKARTDQYYSWWHAIKNAEDSYNALVKYGQVAQEARSVLPNSLKTEIVMTANLREWRHFFKMRTPSGAHPQMRDLATKALKMFQAKVPILFDEFPATPINNPTP